MENIRGLEWDGEALHFLEQTLLPFEEKVVDTQDWRVIVDAVGRLAIRGAPAIGVAAAFASVLAWREYHGDIAAWKEALSTIRSARPTAVNLHWAVERMEKAAIGLSVEDKGRKLAEEAEAIASEDERMCEEIADAGLSLIKPGDVALTHCNTGALVSYGIGTAIGALRRAHEGGRIKHVYACEARPLGQGARLTMWEMDKLGIPSTLLCDSAAGRLMQEGKVDLVILGADRIAKNGDTANKIGTFQLAVLADRFDIPFYVAAPSSTFDCSAESGEDIPIEYRDGDEVANYRGWPVTIEFAGTFNPAFDITPGELISAFIREDGVAYPPYRFAGS